MVTTIHSRGKTLDLATPAVMGIINVTPDSFYTRGQGQDEKTLLETVEKMLNDGAAIIDVGGASTKPGQKLIEPEEELQRIMPAIGAIIKQFPDIWLSVDTYNSRVAIEAVNAGAAMINDVSSGRFDAEMLNTVARLRAPYIAMHMQGTPETMQVSPQYDDVVRTVYDSLLGTCRECEAIGITEIIIDPGFGFGKTVEHNFALLRSLHEFTNIGVPVLAGLSRKSMICKPLKISPEHALNGTTALNMTALMNGANILRVHDVKEAVEVVQLFRQLIG